MMMRMDEDKFVPIPKEKVQSMVGKSVHVSWAKFGCVWKLREINGETATLETPKTRKKITTHISKLCYIREHAQAIREA